MILIQDKIIRRKEGAKMSKKLKKIKNRLISSNQANYTIDDS